MKTLYLTMNIALAVLAFTAWQRPPTKAGLPSAFSPPVLLTDSTFACNDLVQVSLDVNCQALLDADDIVEGFSGDFTEFVLEITNEEGIPVANPVTASSIGDTLTLHAIHLPSGNSCWGRATIEDKLPPTLTCTNYSIPCFLNLNNNLFPTAADNCDPSPAVQFVGQSVDNSNACSGVVITRTFVAFDDYGNASAPCVQILTTTLPALPVFPVDTIWECDVFAAHPNVTGATPLTGNLNTTGSGVPDVALGAWCPYTVSHQDLLVDNSCGGTFTILRTWTVVNWCTGEIFTDLQLVKVDDTTPPAITAPPTYVVGANISSPSTPGGCVAVNYLPPATATDNCHGFVQRIYTPVGEATYLDTTLGASGGIIPFPGLPLGVHTIVYHLTDECGNIDTLQVPVTVADLTAPQTACDELTSVSLDNFGFADVFAESFDDGSHDNCCLDSFSVRRMTAPCDTSDLIFRNFVTFCCEDVGTLQTVVFRAVDCAGNYNDCMVLVEVEDKLPPVLVHCPPAQAITCSFYESDLEIPLAEGDFSVLNQFGAPIFQDNCHLIFLDTSVAVNLSQCQEGTIVRHWQVTDPGENAVLNCQQTIFVEHVSDWVVEFPADLTVTCGNSIPPTGEPEIFFADCELIATTYEDEIFTVVPDACFKIARRWTVINWCVVGQNIDQEVAEQPENQLGLPFPLCDLDGDGDCDSRTFRDSWRGAAPVPNPFAPTAYRLRPGASDATSATNPDTDLDSDPWDGYIAYEQVIKVVDNTDPVVACPPVQEVCIFEADCNVTFSLPESDLDIEDCSTVITVTASGDLGTGLGPFADVPPGIYLMTYYVTDGCNNAAACQTEIVVKDCKAPTPICKNGLSVTLGQDTTVTIHADDLDAGSFDNCPGELTFSFSAFVSDSVLTFNCFSLGFLIVQVWVTDAAGNQDFCETFVFVDDNQGVCQGAPLVAGAISTASGQPVAGVHVGLNGGTQGMEVTGSDGNFVFEVPDGGDYTLTPVKDIYPLNGVTTFDLVLISKHILGSALLDSPYKIIAADANHSNTVTTADLVVIRKLILQINTSFTGNKSWRFVDKAFVFPNPGNPFATPFPEVLNFNNLDEDVLDADFVGVKVGDVNFSANPQQ